MLPCHICQGRCVILPFVSKAENNSSLDLLFRALADPTRLRLLNLIADREICVCYFVEILRISQPKVSRHLAYLRRAGIAVSRREGKWMHYRLVAPKDQAAASILHETLKHLKEKPEMRRDISRLSSACCAPQKYELLQTAPQPAILSTV
jgi:ArsR family transcriptional regulator, arsenate/arsenite/antimonite-responsive transcriptional repressor